MENRPSSMCLDVRPAFDDVVAAVRDRFVKRLCRVCFPFGRHISPNHC